MKIKNTLEWIAVIVTDNSTETKAHPHSCEHTMVHVAVKRQLNSFIQQRQIGILNNGFIQRHKCHFSLQSITVLGWMTKGGLWDMATSSSAYQREWALTERFLRSRHLNEPRQKPPGMWCEKKWMKKHQRHIPQWDIGGSSFWKKTWNGWWNRTYYKQYLVIYSLLLFVSLNTPNPKWDYASSWPMKQKPTCQTRAHKDISIYLNT